jgi:hypothetical protein
MPDQEYIKVKVTEYEDLKDAMRLRALREVANSDAFKEYTKAISELQESCLHVGFINCIYCRKKLK